MQGVSNETIYMSLSFYFVSSLRAERVLDECMIKYMERKENLQTEVWKTDFLWVYV